MTVIACTRPAGNLPAEVTSLVGRRREVAEVKRLLCSSRLVTLTGVGGVGKTRVALRVAAELHRAFSAVRLVDLSRVRDPALVPQMVAAAVGFDGQASVEGLSLFLADRRVLLVLDNCEHLLDACAVLADALLPAAPELRILATSRQSLGVYGEHVLTVLPLSVPDPDRPPPSVEALYRFESASLFAQRAAAVVPEFVIDDRNLVSVVRICHRLEGIPLAIELAAGWLRAIPVGGLAVRLDDRFRWLTGGSRAAAPRQQTMRATVDWSLRLLSARQQTLLERVSVFAGRFDLEAAEAVCAGGPIGREEILDLLYRLVDKSLLLREEDSGLVYYRMLDTIRQFCRRQHVDHAGLARRHRDWYLGLAERAASEWTGSDGCRWRVRLRNERFNLRDALRFCLTDPGEAAAGLRVAVALHRVRWLADNDPEHAATLLGAVESIARGAGIPLSGGYVERCGARLRQRLGDEEFDRSYARGTRLSTEEAIMCFDPPAGEDAPPEREPSDEAPSTLTRRENQIAELITEGMSNRQIATALVIAQRTVEGHVEHILTKLGFNSRSQIAAWVARGTPNASRPPSRACS
jgi:predicted ATPase/DNA-binding CsgD family transcriptional regulator